MPLAPWALLICWWSSELEIHSKRVLLRGETGVGMKIHSELNPHQSPRSQLGSSAPRPHLTQRSGIGGLVTDGYHQLHKPRVGKLPPGKVSSPHGWDPSPCGDLLWNAALAFWAASHMNRVMQLLGGRIPLAPACVPRNSVE